MPYSGWRVLASHFWGSLTSTFCYMPHICRGTKLALYNFTSEFPSLFICWIWNFCDFVWETHLLSILPQPLSPACKSYRKTVAAAPKARCFYIHSISFPFLSQWWIKTFGIVYSFSNIVNLFRYFIFKSYKIATFYQPFSNLTRRVFFNLCL